MNSGSRQQAYFDKDQPPITHRSLDNPSQERDVSKNWQESKVGKAEQSVSTGYVDGTNAFMFRANNSLQQIGGSVEEDVKAGNTVRISNERIRGKQ